MTKQIYCDKQYSFVFSSLLISGKLKLSRFFLAREVSLSSLSTIEPLVPLIEELVKDEILQSSELPTDRTVYALELEAKPRLGPHLSYILSSYYSLGSRLIISERSGVKINTYSLNAADLAELEDLPFRPVLELAFEILEEQRAGSFLTFVGRNFAELNSLKSLENDLSMTQINVTSNKVGDQRVQRARFRFRKGEVHEIVVDSPLGKVYLKRALDK